VIFKGFQGEDGITAQGVHGGYANYAR